MTTTRRRAARAWKVTSVAAALAAAFAGCTERLPLRDGGASDGLAADARVDTHDSSPDVERRDALADTAPDIGVSSWPAPCGPRNARFVGALCGGKACAIGVQAIISETGSSPALEIDGNGAPMVFHRVPGSGFVGRFARLRSDGSWSSESLPVTTAGATLSLLDGKPLMLAYDGALHQTLLVREASGWRSIHSFAGKGWGGFERSLAVDSAGCVHATRVEIVQQGGKRAELATYFRRDQSGSWTRYRIGPSNWYAPLALAPDGDAHLAYWGSGSTPGWALYHGERGVPKRVTPLGVGGANAALSERRIGLELIDGAAGPTVYITMLRERSDGREIVLASGALGASSYAMTVIASEPRDKKCQQMPTQDGEVCSYDDVDYTPLAFVASGDGDVRMLLGKHREHGTLKANCPYGVPAAPIDAGPPPLPCTWEGERKSAGDLVIAARDGGGVFTLRTLVGGLDAVEASTRVDGQGRIHAAVSARDGKLRYLRLEQ